MKIFNQNFCLKIILIFFLFITAKTNTEVTEKNKLKVRACIKLQQKKFDENEEKINEFIKKKSEKYNLSQNKIMLLALAYCYDKISLELTNEVLKLRLENINIENQEIKDIYEFENYNYDDQENNKRIFNNFIPSFEVVFKEIRDKEDREAYKDRFNIYFIHTYLFKFFVFYLIINSIIIFYIRLKNKDQYIDKTYNFDNNEKNNNNNEKEESNNENKESNKDNNYRKLKKKTRLGKIKKN